jgi:DNA-binding GntR family transcriptional regulator
MTTKASQDGAAVAALAQLGSAETLRIDRSSTAERVADVLRELIIRGELPAGTALREQQLVTSLDVSRNTLREAFRLLGRERLVSYNLHRGVAVTELTESDVADIYRTRAPIELMAIEYSEEASREQLMALLELVVQAEHCAGKGDWNQVARLNIEFHQRLVELIGSERIATFFRVIDAELRLAFAMVADAPGFFAPFIPRNRAIAELLLVGDRDAAKSELTAYLAEAERRIRVCISAG